MPKSQFYKCRRLSPAVRMAIAVLAISATPWGAAQESVRCANPTYEAQKFLQALYPETKEKGYTVLYSVGGIYDPAWTYLPRLVRGQSVGNKLHAVRTALDGKRREKVRAAVSDTHSIFL